MDKNNSETNSETTVKSEILPLTSKLKKWGKYMYKEGTTYIIFFALIILFTCFNKVFLSGENIYNLLTGSTYIIIAGMGIVFVMLTGGIDLSVGYIMSISCCTAAILMTKLGFTPILVFPICVAIGFILGLFNGVLAAKLKLFPLIITLATSTVFQGITYTITKGQTYQGMPEMFRTLATKKFIGLPIDVWVMFIIVALVWFILNKTRFGRDILAVGGNKECARLSGIKVDLITMLCYAICGAIFAFAALDMLAQQNLASASTGPGTEFICLTAAIIGGISMMGGKGNILGLVVGILIMQIISNGMMLAGMGSYTQYIVKGVILLCAVSFDVIKNRPHAKIRINKEKNSQIKQ